MGLLVKERIKFKLMKYKKPPKDYDIEIQHDVFLTIK